jgi:hypothetical protein
VKPIITMALVFAMAASALAMDVKDYFDGPTGVSVKLDDKGAIKGFVAAGESELIFLDGKDAQAATKEATHRATLQAKAKISKFIVESMSSKEVIDDLAKIATDATAEGKAPGSFSISQQILERQRIVFRNSSDAILKGSVILATETSDDNKHIKVVLGTDDEIMRAAVSAAAKVPISDPAVAAPVSGKKKKVAKSINKKRTTSQASKSIRK